MSDDTIGIPGADRRRHPLAGRLRPQNGHAACARADPSQNGPRPMRKGRSATGRQEDRPWPALIGTDPSRTGHAAGRQGGLRRVGDGSPHRQREGGMRRVGKKTGSGPPSSAPTRRERAISPGGRANCDGSAAKATAATQPAATATQPSSQPPSRAVSHPAEQSVTQQSSQSPSRAVSHPAEQSVTQQSSQSPSRAATTAQPPPPPSRQPPDRRAPARHGPPRAPPHPEQIRASRWGRS
jgi:hypothetical protein